MIGFNTSQSIAAQNSLEKGSLAHALITGDLPLAESLILSYRHPLSQKNLLQTFTHKDSSRDASHLFTYADLAAALGYHGLLQQLLLPLPVDNNGQSLQLAQFFLQEDRPIDMLKTIFNCIAKRASSMEKSHLAREGVDYLKTLEVIFESLNEIDPAQNFLNTLYQYREPIENKSLLMLAAEAGNSKIFSLFLQEFPPKLRAEFIHRKTEAGFTALHYACRKGRTKIAEFLIDHGADFMAKDNTMGNTCLDELADQHPTKVRLLVKIARIGGFIGKTIPENWSRMLKEEAEKPEHQGEFFLVGSTTLVNKGVQQFLGPRDIPGAVFTHSEASTTPLNIALTHLNQYKQKEALGMSSIDAKTDTSSLHSKEKGKGKEIYPRAQDEFQAVSRDFEPILAAAQMRIKSVLKYTETALFDVRDDLNKGIQEEDLLLQEKQEIIYEFYLYFLHRDRDTRLEKTLGYRFGHDQALQTYLKTHSKEIDTKISREIYEALPLFTRSLIEAKPVLYKSFSIEEINKIRNEAQDNIKALNNAIIGIKNDLANIHFSNQVWTYDFRSSLFFLNILLSSLVSFAFLKLFFLGLSDDFYPCGDREEGSSTNTTETPTCHNDRIKAGLAVLSSFGFQISIFLGLMFSCCLGREKRIHTIPHNERKMLERLSSDVNLLLHVLKDENGEAINLSSNKQAQFYEACQHLTSAYEHLHKARDLEKVQATLRDIETALNTILGVINTTAYYQELLQFNIRYDQAKMKASRDLSLEQGKVWFNQASSFETATKPLLLSGT